MIKSISPEREICYRWPWIWWMTHPPHSKTWFHSESVLINADISSFGSLFTVERSRASGSVPLWFEYVRISIRRMWNSEIYCFSRWLCGLICHRQGWASRWRKNSLLSLNSITWWSSRVHLHICRGLFCVLILTERSLASGSLLGKNW